MIFTGTFLKLKNNDSKHGMETKNEIAVCYIHILKECSFNNGNKTITFHVNNLTPIIIYLN